MPSLKEWVDSFPLTWLGTSKADTDALAVLGANLEVVAGAHHISYDERGNGNERYCLVLTADRLIEVSTKRTPKTENDPAQLSVHLTVYPLRLASSVKLASTYHISSYGTTRPAIGATVTFLAESKLPDLVIPRADFTLDDHEEKQFHQLAATVISYVK